jgi:hypothetical protein
MLYKTMMNIMEVETGLATTNKECQMTITWDRPYKQKHLTFIFGKEWDREDFKLFGFRKVPLGWNMNIWRFLISYDDWGKVKK